MWRIRTIWRRTSSKAISWVRNAFLTPGALSPGADRRALVARRPLVHPSAERHAPLRTLPLAPDTRLVDRPSGPDGPGSLAASACAVDMAGDGPFPLLAAVHGCAPDRELQHLGDVVRGRGCDLGVTRRAALDQANIRPPRRCGRAPRIDWLAGSVTLGAIERRRRCGSTLSPSSVTSDSVTAIAC